MNFLQICLPGLPQIRCAFQIWACEPGSDLLNAAGEFCGENYSLDIPCDVPATIKRRQEFSKVLGVASWAEMQQEHGLSLVVDPAPADPEHSSGPVADALATNKANFALCVKSADCQPIMLAHASGAIAAIHSGWRGNKNNFPIVAVEKFCSHFHIKPEEIWAIRGPSLGPKQAQFIHFDEEWDSDFLPWFDKETQCMDLWSLTRHQLTKAGLPAGQILSLDICTAETPWLFSFRRAPQCGRVFSAIWRIA